MKNIDKKINLKEIILLLSDYDIVIEYSKNLKLESIVFNNITYNSNDVDVNTLFICKGNNFKEEYLLNSLDKGVACYISEKKYENIPNSVGFVIVKDIRKALAVISNEYYDYSWRNFKSVGITGTKGKTTTSYFMKNIFDEFTKSKNAIISSIEIFDGKNNISSSLTTPESLELHSYFNNAVKNDVKYLVMEVSSQSIKLDRVFGVHYNVGVFLNISEDHISPNEHKSFDDYFSAKLELFKNCDIAVINGDSDYIENIIMAAQGCKTVVTYGFEEKYDIYAKNIKKQDGCISFDVVTPKYTKNFKIIMAGLFNVSNALAAISTAYVLDIPPEVIYDGLAKTTVKGRMEIYTNKDKNITAIVDYAHNKLSFEKIFDTIQKEYPNSNIISVFGAPGDKAFVRRKDLGLIAGKYSKKCFLTKDDPGSEDVINICKDIATYIDNVNGSYEIETNRADAIKKAIAMALPNDIILIAGKGSETTQKLQNTTEEYKSDSYYAKLYLEEK